MAHEIAFINGQAAISYLGESPWHRLGTPISATTARDLQASLIAASLTDWAVRSESLYFADGRLNEHAKGVVRGLDNVILGAVGPNTEIVQNEEAFGIVEPLVQEFGASVEVAGALGHGERVWALLKMPTSIEPVVGDPIDGYLLVKHGHDNSTTLEGIPTTVRVVCANTLRAAVDAAGGDRSLNGRVFRLKKTANVRERIDTAKTLVRRMATTMNEMGDTFAALAARKVTPSEIDAYIDAVFPRVIDPATRQPKESKTLDARRVAVRDAVFTSAGADLAGADLATGSATAYALLQGVTAYFDHVRPGEAKSQSAVRSAQESALFGANAATKLLALSQARQLLAA
jgi:phage/plasmid-like protein (TIGR03299 family)